MTAEADANWYVVQTQANSELKAASHLRRQEFDVYLPRYLKRRRHARKVETVAAPLFPRYLFVAIDRFAQRWRVIQSTVGVSRLICHGDEPTAVPPGIIDEIRRRENPNGLVQIDAASRFATGDRVRIVDGVFSASVGLFDKMTDSDRVSVFLELLGRKVKVVLDADAVAVA